MTQNEDGESIAEALVMLQSWLGQDLTGKGYILTDFSLAQINAAQQVFPGNVSQCATLEAIVWEMISVYFKAHFLLSNHLCDSYVLSIDMMPGQVKLELTRAIRATPALWE